MEVVGICIFNSKKFSLQLKVLNLQLKVVMAVAIVSLIRECSSVCIIIYDNRDKLERMLIFEESYNK